MDLATAAIVKSGVNLSNYKMIDHKLEKRLKRDDHEIIWESNDKLAGEATHRMTVDVIGDEVNGPRHWVKIPEDWERQRQQRGIRAIAVLALGIAAGLLAVILAALAISKIAVYWRLHMTLGVIAAVIRVLASVNEIPQ